MPLQFVLSLTVLTSCLCHCVQHTRPTTPTTTVAGPEADLDVFGDAELYIVPANNTLTFEHSYAWWGEWQWSGSGVAVQLGESSIASVQQLCGMCVTWW